LRLPGAPDDPTHREEEEAQMRATPCDHAGCVRRAGAR
jgi:hypothetical protein